MSNEFNEEQKSLSTELNKARSLSNDANRVIALRDFVALTESSSLPECLKDRFKLNAERDIQSICFKHADIDLIK